MEINIDSILKTIETAQDIELKQAIKDTIKSKASKVKDLKTGLLRKVGKINSLKFDILKLYKEIDAKNDATTKIYQKVAEQTTKEKIQAVRDFMVEKRKLKEQLSKGVIDKAKYKKEIAAANMLKKDLINSADSKYFHKIKNINAFKRKELRGLFARIAKLETTIKDLKSVRQKHLKIAVGVGIAVVSVVAIGIKAYSMIMTKLRNPCRKLKTNEEKTVCNIIADIDGLHTKIITLKDQSLKCKLSEDPVECNQKINEEIEKAKNQIKKLKEKLDKFEE